MTVSIYKRQRAVAFILSIYSALGIGTSAYADTTGFVVPGGLSSTCGPSPVDVTTNKSMVGDKMYTAANGYIRDKQTPPPPPGRFVPVTQNVKGNQIPQQYSSAAMQNDLQLVKQGLMTPAAFQQKLQQAAAGAKQSGPTLP